MLSSTLKWSAVFLLFLAPVFLQGQNEGFAEPDSILLKDGSTQRGVIVKNTAEAVFLQQRYQISEFPKSAIVRIFDGVDVGMEFTEAEKKGDLPSWRVMVNDIRNNDAIKSLRQIPATLIDNGYLKNVPYLSFRINDYIEMNVYGNPDDPAAIEFGVYGKLASWQVFCPRGKRSLPFTRFHSAVEKKVRVTSESASHLPPRRMPTALGGFVCIIPRRLRAPALVMRNTPKPRWLSGRLSALPAR
jgi:hypothetical protein